MRAQKSQELMTSVWDSIKVSNCVREVCKGRESYLMTFGFTSYKIARVVEQIKDHIKNFQSKPATSFSGIV